VSALATEMKSYAKTLPGSVYSIDRRTDAVTERPGEPERALSHGGVAGSEQAEGSARSESGGKKVK
jgi:hypothetical protein